MEEKDTRMQSISSFINYMQSVSAEIEKVSHRTKRISNSPCGLINPERRETNQNLVNTH